MDTQDHAIYHVWMHFFPTTLYPRREKTIWSELESNPGPLASQATALTTRPLLLGQLKPSCYFGFFFESGNDAADRGEEGFVGNEAIPTINDLSVWTDDGYWHWQQV